MKYAVIVTERAKTDIIEIADHLFRLTGDKQKAVDFAAAVKSKTEVLKDFPGCGAVPADDILASMGFRFLVYKNYLIFYRTDEAAGKVYISTVFHAKLDYTRYMKQFRQ